MTAFTALGMERPADFDPQEEYIRLIGVVKKATTDEEYDNAIDQLNQLKGQYSTTLATMASISSLRPSEVLKTYKEKLKKLQEAIEPQEQEKARYNLRDFLKRHPEARKYQKNNIKK